jgi:Fe-S-cluster containining protein
MVIGAIAALDEALKTQAEIHPILEDIAEFPYDIKPDGSCSMLDGDICKVYQARPLICNTDWMYQQYWSKVMTLDQWYQRTKLTCDKLRGKVRKNGNN